MMEFKACKIVLKNGREFFAERITETAICIVGLHSGFIYVTANGKKGVICLDDVDDILA